MYNFQILAIASLVAFAGYVYCTLKGPLARLPGPWYSNWTDLVRIYYVLSGKGPSYVQSLHEKYGPLVRVSPHSVDVSDITAARTVHNIKNEFPKSSWYYSFNSGENLFTTTDIPYHRRHRRLLSGPLSETGLKAMIPVIDGKIQLTIQRMKQEMESRGAVDILKWWLFLTTDVIGQLTFGDSFNMLETGEKNQYIQDLEDLAASSGLRMAFPKLSLLAGYLHIPGLQNAEVNTKRLVAYSEESLERHRKLVERDPENSPATLFSKLYKAGEEGLSPAELRDEAQAYIIAGSDTTSNTLTYLVWSVCRSPIIKTKLVDELLTVPPKFAYDDIRDLPYLNMVIEETLRLYSAAPAGLPRIVPPGGADLAGHHLPAGSTVSTQAYSLHRDPNVFPRAEEFIPERWETPTKGMKDAFMPFGGGSRVCIGLHLARMQLRLGTARFFHTFPRAEVSGLEKMSDEEMTPKLYFLIRPQQNRCLIRAW
ncbi:hypothetical protein JX266_002427 [Neoarthrinium moseri]|nr:hypothetical protein JX266_002427 [Neoarthrinium moseri]